MNPETKPADRPFAEGDLCLLIDPKDRRHMLVLRGGQHFHHPRFGRVDHTDIIGKPPGIRLRGLHFTDVICLRPTLEEFIMRRLKRHTQIIYPKDLGSLALYGDIFPGARVLESGIGSGAASLTILRALSPGGKLVSYERREEFADLARRTIADFVQHYGDLRAEHEVEVRDVYEGIDERDLNTVLLDVPEPHNALPHVWEALCFGGVLLCWLPTVLQIHTLVRALQEKPGWAEIDTTETLVRHWDVNEKAIRPAQRMVAHTGFLIRARKVAPFELGTPVE